MPWVEASACHHCGAARPVGARAADGCIRCAACDRWYTAKRWEVEPLAAPASPPATPPAKPKGARIEQAPELPADLVRLGFKIVVYEDTMIAVSPTHGCSKRSADVAEVIRMAREIAGFIRFMLQKAEEDSHG